MTSIQNLHLMMNWRQMDYFIAAIGGLAGLCILLHISRRLGHKMMSGKRRIMPLDFLTPLSRVSRSMLLQKIPLFPSAGHAVLVFCYALINLILFVTNTDYETVSRTFNYGSRAGWLATGNLVLAVFLSLKNTPLALFTPWSFERLTTLHRAAGVTTIVFVMIHALCDTVDYARRGILPVLATRKEVYGEVAGVALLMTGVVGFLVRRWWYELFYVLHVALWMLVAVMTCLHQPLFGKKVLTAMLVAIGIWVLDRLIRTARLLVYGVNNSVTLTALPKGATRVTLTKGPLGAVPGEHCFLYVPRIRHFQTHPFTLVSTDPFEFVVSAQDGFTRDLHKYALANPGANLAASVEGAYGAFGPNLKDYDTVLLIAGGSGATFAFGTALNMLKNLGQDEKKQIIFVWIVKYEEQLSWFAAHLDTLENDDRVFLQLYVTRSPLKHISPLDTPTTPTENPFEPRIWPRSGSSTSRSIDSEKSLPPAPESTAHGFGDVVQHVRPDVSLLVRTAIEGTRPDRRVLVMGCGPRGLTEEVRNTTAGCIRADGPGVELHCQQFAL